VRSCKSLRNRYMGTGPVPRKVANPLRNQQHFRGSDLRRGGFQL